MAEKKLTVIEMLKVNIRGVKLCNSLIPWNSFLTFLLVALQIIGEYWPCIFLAILVDDVAAGAVSTILTRDAVMLVGGDTVLFVFIYILQHYYFYCGSNIWELANVQLNKKIMELDYEYMESEAVQNRRRDIDSMARDNADGGGINKLFWNIMALLHCGVSILIIFFYTVYLFSRSGMVFKGEPVKAVAFISVFVILLAVLMFIVIQKNKSIQKKIYKRNEEMLPLFRQMHFYTEEYISTEKC